jgi:hypothetical protein
MCPGREILITCAAGHSHACLLTRTVLVRFVSGREGLRAELLRASAHATVLSTVGGNDRRISRDLVNFDMWRVGPSQRCFPGQVRPLSECATAKVDPVRLASPLIRVPDAMIVCWRANAAPFRRALHYSRLRHTAVCRGCGPLGLALACARVLGHTDLHVVVIAASTDAATQLVTQQLGQAARIRLTNQTLPLQSVIMCAGTW